LALNRESLTNKIEDDLAARNQNWDTLDAHLAETVQDSVHGLKTTGDVTIYVDATNGDDANPGTQSQPLKTIGAAVSRITNLIIDINHIVTIQLAPGTYVENVDINNLHGAGNFYLRGGSDLSEANNYVIDGYVKFIGCTCYVYIYGVKVLGSTSIEGAIAFYTCLVGKCYYCKVDRTDRLTSTNNYGVLASFSHTMVLNCDISNVSGGSGINAAIQGFDTTRIYSGNNTGTNNSYGLRVVAATIMKYGTQPSGTVAEETISGGVIR